MIRRRDNTTLVITQTAHGWLSGQFAMYWGNDRFQFPALPKDVIMAAANHDNGWTTWEQKPRIDDNQRPLDFLDMPPATHVTLWRQGIYGLAAQNQYAALLVSLHGRHLVENRLRENLQDNLVDKAWLQAFSVEQLAWETQIIARLANQPYFAVACEEAVLAANLRLLQVFDWFSLLLCMDGLSETVVTNIPGATPKERLEIRIQPLKPRSFTMVPWPFSRPTFDLTVQAHRLPQPTFASHEAFQTAWQASPVETLIFQAVSEP